MKKAIVTLCIGRHFEIMGEITHPLMKLYADKCAADFIVLNEPKLIEVLGLPTYEKFQLYDLLNEYEQIIFIDTDIVVLPDSPNLFDIVDYEVFAAANEEGYSMAKVHKLITQEMLGDIEWIAPYFNSGVMVISKVHKEIFNPSGPLLKKWTENPQNNDHVMSDQPILNYLVNYYSFKFNDLTSKYNHTRVIKDTSTRFNSYFIHYSGPSGHRYGDRLTQIKLDADVVKNSFLLYLSRKFKLYRWIADRFNVHFIKYLYSERFK